MSVHSKKVTFENDQGDQLAARLDLPEGRTAACALFAHCFTCSKDLFIVSQISKHLAGRGVAVLRFDFTGLGHSEGEFENTNFSSNVADLVAAARFMEEEFEAPSILIGHSFGGTAVLKAAAEIPSAKAVATIGSPFDPAHVQHLFADKLDQIEESGQAEVRIAGRSFELRRQFVEDIRSTEMEAAVGGLDRPLLIFHSPTDKIVGIENAKLIYQAARHPKSFISVDGADHLLTDRKDAQFVAEMLSTWSTRYVECREPGHEESPEELGEPHAEEVLVVEADEGKFKNHVAVGRHHFYADEPIEVGGDGAGPDPYDLVAAALGACTSMTLRMYADRKGIPLDKVEVRVTHDKLHARDCESCETDKGKIDKLTRRIRVEGDLDDDQRQRLLDIAGRCPVHETLQRENVVESILVEEFEGDIGDR